MKRENHKFLLHGTLDDMTFIVKKAHNTAEMWRAVTAIWKINEKIYIHVVKDGKLFMKLHRITLKNGKKWAKNDIPESRRTYKKPVESIIPKMKPEENKTSFPEYMLYC